MRRLWFCRWRWRWLRLNLISAKRSQISSSKPGKSPGFVLLIAPSGSYRVTPYVKAAQSLGYGILVVSNSAHSLVAEIANGITVDFNEPEKALLSILAATESLQIRCALATDDSCVELCSRISRHLNLPHNEPRAAQLTHRKDLARLALRVGGCETPDFQIIKINASSQHHLNIDYPVVVKPLALSASRGVIRVDNQQQLSAACERIDKILASSGSSGYPREHLLVESYLEGAEYAVEGFVIDGEFHLLTIFDKPEPLSGPYFEETYYLTPSRLNAHGQQHLVTEIKKCCLAYGLKQGPVHAEARITRRGPVLVELAARTIGGQCGQLIEFSLGKKLEEIVIEGMCGIIPEKVDEPRYAGVLMIPVTDSGILRRVEGLTRALQVEYIVDIEIHIREGYELVPLPEGASYLGFIFAQAPDFDSVYHALKNAYRQLKFVTQPVWKLNSIND